jgi:hypothetical protein
LGSYFGSSYLTQTPEQKLGFIVNYLSVPIKFCFTGTWNIRETKNLSEITMKSSIFKDKVIRKIYYRDNWPQNYLLPGQKTKKSFYRDLDLKRLRTTAGKLKKTFAESL